jgi:hypothetical protein
MNGSQQKRRRQKWFGAFGKRRARRTTGRRLMVEPMEGRVLMTADLGGNSFAAATELGTLSGTRSYTDFVGRTDTNDYYRFQVAGRSEFNLTLEQMTADADVELLNSSGALIARSARGGASAESIRQTLDAGTYFVRVYPFGAANTNYRLALSAAAQQQSPTITSLGGYTSAAAGVQNGLVNMSIGTAWNDYRAVNDQPGLYTWTINGTNFGTQRGEIRLAGQVVPVISWSNTSIRIDPSGAQFNAAQPWNWAPRNAALQITTAAGASVSQNVDVAPAIRSRVYGQCTWHVARRRLEMGLTPSPSAYGGYTAISPAWVPRAGDQLQWSGTHTAIIESVSAPVVHGDLRIYWLTISQYNGTGSNEYGTFQTPFAVRGNRIEFSPSFRHNGAGATSYYR